MKKFFALFVLFSVFYFNFSIAESAPSIEDLANASRPAIVRVVASTNGSIDVPNFVFDYHNFEIIEPAPNEPLIPIPFDSEYNTMDGTGFIISDDGVIVTNSHIINSVIDDQYRYVADYLIQNATDAEIDEAINRFGDTTKAYDAVYAKIYQYIKEKSKKNFTLEVKVMRPDDKSKDFWTLVDNGYKAEVLYSNDNFADDNKDIAILKINETNLPTVSLNDNPIGILVGQKIFTFGFPSSAFFAEGDYLEPTFSQGNLNAIKNDLGVDIYQTDAGVSEGSSGSPMFNSEGEVIGIVTYLSGDNTGGTKFGFAIPITLVNEILKTKNITLKESSFFDLYKLGISLMNEKHCKKAISTFEKINNINSAFGVDKYVKPKIESCKAMIASGQSVDSYFSQVAIWVKSNLIKAITWLVLALLIILLVVLVLRRLKKDEMKIKEMAEEVEEIEKHEKICDNQHGHETIIPIVAKSEPAVKTSPISNVMPKVDTIVKPTENQKESNPLEGLNQNK